MNYRTFGELVKADSDMEEKFRNPHPGMAHEDRKFCANYMDNDGNITRDRCKKHEHVDPTENDIDCLGFFEFADSRMPDRIKLKQSILETKNVAQVNSSICYNAFNSTRLSHGNDPINVNFIKMNENSAPQMQWCKVWMNPLMTLPGTTNYYEPDKYVEYCKKHGISDPPLYKEYFKNPDQENILDQDPNNEIFELQ